MGPQVPRSLKLDDLPPEVLDHIIPSLPPSSIVDLMVNRRMRFVCEHHLYRTIRLMPYQERSLQLLKTLALRPDLAILVRELQINLKWYHPQKTASDDLQPDGLAALSLAKNIHTLKTSGLRWLTDPSLSRVREVVSQMELTSLFTSGLLTGAVAIHYEPSHALPSNLRAILQSQPQLESFVMTAYNVDPALSFNIETADVPNLTQFDGPPNLAEAVSNAAPRLTNIKFACNINDMGELQYPEISNGHRIRALHINVFLNSATSSRFTTFLASFPNVESLSLLSLDWFLGEDSPSSYFAHNLPCLHPLTQLRTLKIGAYLTFPNDPGLAPQNILKFKEWCPSLERFVDEANRDWVYVPSNEDGSNFRAILEFQTDEEWDNRDPPRDV